MNEFNPAAAYVLAEKMLRSALRRGDIYYALTAQDREDLLQEAVCEMWRAAVLTGRTDAGYLAGAARKAIFYFVTRIWFGRYNPRPGSLRPLLTDEDGDDSTLAPDPEHRAGVSTEITAAVWQRLYAERVKKGRRGEDATDRDVAILYLLTRGYRTTAIAAELDIPANSVKTYRARLRARLRAWSATT